MAGVKVTIALNEQGQTLTLLAVALARSDAFECVKDVKRRIDSRVKCDCFDCVPLTMEQACIRYLAGYNQDFRFIDE